MAESWRTAYGRVKMELEEYKGTIVPALTRKIRELEAELEAARLPSALVNEGDEADAGLEAGYAEREKVYMNAFIHYGEVHQSVVAMEELSECQKEIAKFIRGLGNAGALAEEVADALICLEQVMMIYGIREMVTIQRDRKVMRLEDKLRREAMASGLKNEPGDCHGASPLAMTRKGETA